VTPISSSSGAAINIYRASGNSTTRSITSSGKALGTFEIGIVSVRISLTPKPTVSSITQGPYVTVREVKDTGVIGLDDENNITIKKGG
ncbi:MAG: hypothetical protein VW518_00550, partial [Burkholderiaceae bacterium]